MPAPKVRLCHASGMLISEEGVRNEEGSSAKAGPLYQLSLGLCHPSQKQQWAYSAFSTSRQTMSQQHEPELNILWLYELPLDRHPRCQACMPFHLG